MSITARLAFDLAFEDLIKVVAVSHPSRLQVPEDLEVCKFSLDRGVGSLTLNSATRALPRHPC